MQMSTEPQRLQHDAQHTAHIMGRGAIWTERSGAKSATLFTARGQRFVIAVQHSAVC